MRRRRGLGWACPYCPSAQSVEVFYSDLSRISLRDLFSIDDRAFKFNGSAPSSASSLTISMLGSVMVGFTPRKRNWILPDPSDPSDPKVTTSPILDALEHPE